MKLNIKLFPLFLVICLTTFVACQKDATIKGDNALRSIPEDASMVSSIDIKSLMDKADFNYVKSLDFYQHWLSQSRQYNPAIAKMLEDPSKTGIDLTKKAYVTVDVSKKNPEDIFSGVILNLSDVSVFEAMIKDAGSADILDNEFYKVIKFNANNIVAWDNETAVIGGSSISKIIDPNLEKIFNTTDETAIIHNEDLQKCFEGEHDIVNWINSNAIAQIPEAKLAMDMINVKSSALKDNFLHGYFDFEKGTVLGHGDFFIQDGIARDLKLFFKDQVKTDFIPFIPGDNLSGVFSGALDLNGIQQVLSERSSVKSFVEFTLKEYGVTIEDIATALGGDFVMASYGKGANVHSLMITTLNDGKAFDNFITLGKDYEWVKEISPSLYELSKSQALSVPGVDLSMPNARYMLVDQDKVFISSDELLLRNIQSGDYKPAAPMDNKVKALVNEHIFSSFIDFSTIAQNNEAIDDGMKDMEFSIDRNSFDLNFQMKNTDQNSLKSFFELMNKEFLKSKKNKSI